MRDYPAGRCALPSFFPAYIAPGLADADANVRARAVFVKQWWRQACTNTAAGHNFVRIVPSAARHAGDQLLLNQHVAHVKGGILAAAGVGGPGLTTAAFQAWIANMQATLDHNAAERIRHENARSEKTFTGKYGDAIAQRMHRLCNVPDDAGLPDIHNLLVKAPSKSHDYAIIQGLIQERTQASAAPLPVNCAHLRLPSSLTRYSAASAPGATD